MKKGFKSIIIAMGVLTLYLIISLWTNVTIENTNMGVLMSVSRKSRIEMYSYNFDVNHEVTNREDTSFILEVSQEDIVLGRYLIEVIDVEGNPMATFSYGSGEPVHLGFVHTENEGTYRIDISTLSGTDEYIDFELEITDLRFIYFIKVGLILLFDFVAYMIFKAQTK